MEDQPNNNNIRNNKDFEVKEKQEDDQDRKFTKILEMDQKQKKLDEFNLLKGRNLNLFNELFNILEDKIKQNCNDNIEKLFVYSKKVDNNNLISSEDGYEKEFKTAETELINCVNKFNYYKEYLENEIVNLKRLTTESYSLCKESCKEEMKAKNLTENMTKNCLNGCFKFLLMNKEIFNDIIKDELINTKDEIMTAKI